MSRRGRLYAIVLVVATVTLMAFMYWNFRILPRQRRERHERVFDQISQTIVGLCSMCPPDFDPNLWEFHVAWTWQLHSQCGIPSLSDSDRLQQFADDLDSKVSGPVDATTIDWIWDEYVKVSRMGKMFENRHRPTVPGRFNNRPAWTKSFCGKMGAANLAR